MRVENVAPVPWLLLSRDGERTFALDLPLGRCVCVFASEPDALAYATVAGCEKEYEPVAFSMPGIVAWVDDHGPRGDGQVSHFVYNPPPLGGVERETPPVEALAVWALHHGGAPAREVAKRAEGI